ncbi:MAG: hypothetical protein V1934_03820 [Methanobacteriota archaeon]
MNRAIADVGSRVARWLQSPVGFTALTLLSLVLAIVASLNTRPLMRLSPDSQFGILNVIPWEYWLAIAMSFSLMVANVFNKKRGYFPLSILIFVVLFVNIESFFLAEPVGSTDAYLHFVKGAALADSGNTFFSFDLGAYPNGYFGSFMFTKVVAETMGLGNGDVVFVLSVFRFLVPLWFFGCMYYLFTKLTTLRRARGISIVMILGIPYFQFHWSPHAFGLILLPILLYTVAVPSDNRKKCLAIQVLLFTLLIFTHGPTAIYFALTYAFIVFMHRLLIFAKKSPSELNVSAPVAAYFLVGMVLTNPMISHLASVTFNGGNSLSVLANAIGVSAGGAGPFSPGQVGLPGLERVGGHFLIPELIRLCVLGAFFALSVFGTFKMFKNGDFRGTNLLAMGSFAATGIFSIGNILFPSMNMGDRSFLYLSLGSVIMVIYLLREGFPKVRWTPGADKRKALVTLVLALLMLSPAIGAIAYHYNQGSYFTPPQNRDRYLYTIWHANAGSVYSYGDNHGIMFSKRPFIELGVGEMYLLSLVDFDPQSPRLNQAGTYFVFTDSSLWHYTWEERPDDYQAIQNYCETNCDLVYCSPGNVVYYILL